MTLLLNNNQKSIINWFSYFFASAGSIFKIVVLIAFNRSALLLYCLPPSYNFIFTIDQRFLIGFSSGFDGGHHIIFSPANLSWPKNLPTSLDTYKGVLLYIKTNFTLKLLKLRLLPCKESLFHSIAIVSSVQFNSFIDFEWSNNSLVDNSHPYPYTIASLSPSFTHGLIWRG